MSKRLGLVVEDDEDLAVIFSEALRAAGFETEIIRDGAQAAQRLKDEDAPIPDIVVLDLHLPHVSGMDLLEQIRAGERTANIRVLIATADASLVEMLEEQADLVLLKPISFIQLRMLASRLVNGLT